MTKKSNFKKNGKKGGRPKGNTYKSVFTLPEADTVILTETQYKKLVKRYGKELIQYALRILEEWLNNSPKGYKHRGHNNYAHFRSDGWIINEARLSIQQT